MLFCSVVIRVVMCLVVLLVCLVSWCILLVIMVKWLLVLFVFVVLMEVCSESKLVWFEIWVMVFMMF